MFERYSESARRMLFFSRYESSQLGDVSIRSEHLLLGLLRDPGGIARRVLDVAKVTPEQLRKDVEAQVQARAKTSTSVEIPFADDAKHVLQFAANEADQLGHDYIGTEHLLLGMLREEQSVAGRLLAKHGVELPGARKTITELAGVGATDTRVASTINPDALIDELSKLCSDLAAAEPQSIEAVIALNQVHIVLARFREYLGR